MQQIITYNNASLPYNTLNVAQEMLYADDGRTRLGIRYKFTVTGLVIDDGTTTMVSKIAAFRNAWQMPRRAFTVKYYDDTDALISTLYDFAPRGNGAFAANMVSDYGPTPGSFDVEQFAGGNSCRYKFTIDCVKITCENGVDTGGIEPGLLSIIFKFEHHVDQSGFVRRTTTGRLLVTSTDGSNADDYRDEVFDAIPPIQNFNRILQNFETSPDGLSLLFSIIDQQVWSTYPPGITNGECTFTGSRDIKTAGLQTNQLQGWFEVPSNGSKVTILGVIEAIVNSKKPKVGDAIPGKPGETFDQEMVNNSQIIQMQEITDDLFNNRLSFRFQWTTNMAGGGPPFLPGLGRYAVNTITGWTTDVGVYGITPQGEIISPVVSPYDYCSGGGITNSTLPPQPTYVTGDSHYETGTDTGDYSDVTITHMRSPFIEYKEALSWEIDENARVFTPKRLCAAVHVQIMGQPIVTVIQTGFSKRQVPRGSTTASDYPAPPLPIYDSSTAKMLNRTIHNDVPYTMDTNSDCYSCNWSYVMRMINLNTTKLAYTLTPQNPRVEHSTIHQVPMYDGGTSGC